jgi:hypothetical protein
MWRIMCITVQHILETDRMNEIVSNTDGGSIQEKTCFKPQLRTSFSSSALVFPIAWCVESLCFPCSSFVDAVPRCRLSTTMCNDPCTAGLGSDGIGYRGVRLWNCSYLCSNSHDHQLCSLFPVLCISFVLRCLKDRYRSLQLFL